MRRHRPALFRGRHFEAEIIVLCVRWYLRFGLSFRNLEEMMVERNLAVDHCHDLGLGAALRARAQPSLPRRIETDHPLVAGGRNLPSNCWQVGLFVSSG